MYLPYEQEASSTPVHLNMMLKSQAPDLVIDPEALLVEGSALWVEDYNGTSMAAPYVAGAVASIANAYPQDTVKARIARVDGSVQKTESLKDKTVSGGVLDLEKSNHPEPAFEKPVIQKNGELEIQGNFFREGSRVTINGQDVKIKSQTEKSLVIEGNYYNKKLQIEVTMESC